MSTDNKLTALLGVKYPIIQAPMAGVSTPQLAAAVSNAGGLGSIGIGASSNEKAIADINLLKELTNRPFNVNVFCHRPPERDKQAEQRWIEHISPLFKEIQAKPPAQLNEIYTSFIENEALFQHLLRLRPPVVSFHFGLPPTPWISALKSKGIVTFATATNLNEAIAIEKVGVDAVIAQGMQAGGHRGVFDEHATDQLLETAQLTTQLVEHTPLPVIAAGGLMSGHDIRQMLNLGASASQLGTAFILCPESAASDDYRATLRNKLQASDTLLTKTLSGRPARGVVNRYIKHGSQSKVSPATYPLAYDIAKQLYAGAPGENKSDFAAHWAGTGVGAIKELKAADLVQTLIAEFHS